MSEKIPFDDDVMTLFMGLGGPEEPGQHGRKTVPKPDNDAIEIVTQIRDLCEEFLMKFDKEPSEEKKAEKPEKEDIEINVEEKPEE